MKKLLLLVAALFSISFCYAGGRSGSAPESSGGFPLPVEFGGMTCSTSAGSSDAVQVKSPCTVYGVRFTTGSNLEYIDIWDSTSSVAAFYATQYVARVYNSANSTTSAGVTGYAGGLNLVGNIKAARGLIWKASVASFNLITVLYNKE